MADTEQQAMSEERLARIADWLEEARELSDGPAIWPQWATSYAHDVAALLAEVARLRAREAALLAVVRAVAEAIQYNVATVTAGDVDRTIIGHAYMACVSPTIQAQARALVASAGDVEQGEA